MTGTSETVPVPVGVVLSPHEVAERLQLPEKTLAQWRYLGKGPRWFRAGRHIRYLAGDVDAFILEERSAAGNRRAS